MALFSWTGHPVVDTGFAVAIVKAGKRRPEEMTIDDFKNVIGDGQWLAEANTMMNSYVCLFANAFLNRQVKDKDKPLQQTKYKRILTALINDMQQSLSNKSVSTDLCECTGTFPSANRALALLTEQLREDKILKKDQRLDIGRNAFPLIGSITNDAGALPSASREPKLSAFALLCAQLAPLATVMLKGKIVFFQYTEPNLLIPHAKSAYSDTISKLEVIKIKSIKNASISAIGTGKGSRSLVLILLNEFNRLKNIQEIEELPEHIALNLWLIINSGTSFDCEIIEIPNETLKFLWQAAVQFPDEIKDLLKKDHSESIFDCIISKKDYLRLYPQNNSKPIPIDLLSKAKTILNAKYRTVEKISEDIEENEISALTVSKIELPEDKQKKKKEKKTQNKTAKKEPPKSIVALLNREFKSNKDSEIKTLIDQINASTSRPASKGLFAFYQNNIVGSSTYALKVAEWIAFNLRETFSTDKEKKQLQILIQHLGDYKDPKQCKRAIRNLLGEFADKGVINYEQYLALFPITGHNPIRVNNPGWNYIWFYLNHNNLNSNPPTITKEDILSIDSQFRQSIKEFAKDVFEWYSEKHGTEKFKRVVLDGFRNDKIKDSDLQRWFCNLGEIPGKENYTNETWDELCRDDYGKNRTFELRFQLRLELANLYRKKVTDGQINR